MRHGRSEENEERGYRTWRTLSPKLLLRAPHGYLRRCAGLPRPLRPLPLPVHPGGALGRARLLRLHRPGHGPGSRTIIPVRSPATRTRGRACSGTGPTAASDDRAGREAGRRQLALLRGGCRVVVRLGSRTHPNGGFQRRLSGHRNATLVEAAVALSGLRSHPRARGDRLCHADADRAAVGGGHSRSGESRRGVRTLVGMAALSRSSHPASRGAFRGLPFRSQRQAALPVSGPWRSALCSALGNLFCRFLYLPGQLRRLRRHLREHWCCRRSALIPLPLRFCGVAGCRAQCSDPPIAFGQQNNRRTTAVRGSEEDIDMSNEGRYRQRLNTLAANWRALALRGLVALLFGLVVLFWPGLVFAVLALLFGIYAVVDGAITFLPALRSSERGARRWLPLAEGAVGVIAGLAALLLSGMAGIGLVYVIVGWAVVTGTLKLLTAILLRAEVESGWLLAGSGALSVLFGVLLAALAGADVPFLAPLVATFAVVVGLALIVFALRLRERE